MVFDTSKIQGFWFPESTSILKTTEIASFGVASLVPVKVKQSRYRPGVAQRVPEG